MVRSLKHVLAVAAALMVGCGSKIPEPARTALEGADQLELLSIDPSRRRETSADDFHGWRVLGRTQVQDADARKRLAAALRKGAGESDGSVAACFSPRHGVRATHAGKTVDLVICFECLQVKVYSADEPDGSFLTAGSPQPVFDQILREAGVPLAEAAGK